MAAHGTIGIVGIGGWVILSQNFRLFIGDLVRPVPYQGIMRRGLIGKGIRDDPAIDQAFQ